MADAFAIEIHHRRDAMAVVARLPGVSVEDLHIAFTRDELVIEAQPRARSASQKRAFHLPLASPIDERRATMRFAEGVLSLHLPKLAR